MEKTLHHKYLVMVSPHQIYFLQVYILQFFKENEKALEKKKRKDENTFEKKKQNNVTPRVSLVQTLEKQCYVWKQCFSWDEPKNFPPFSMPHEIHLE
jgi:hypothetical protein